MRRAISGAIPAGLLLGPGRLGEACAAWTTVLDDADTCAAHAWTPRSPSCVPACGPMPAYPPPPYS
ncbi:hypothetical protein ACIBSV_48715 [Embleya sp. NPDC050154]|uniref:hypothetical protein n=1 Tax=Embleya sp. NPDC050154 TaxID=3363988 RepID=UPI003792BEDC